MSSSTSNTPHPYEISIGERRIGPALPVLVIAEAGTSHMGDTGHARELIDAAAESGADCIKFQWVIADEIVHRSAGNITLPGGSIPIWERFRQLERPASFYAELKEYTEKHGLLFLCSPFGTESARQLLDLKVEAVKIASPELNHYPLLKATAKSPLLLSTGVSSLGDIERSIDYVRSLNNETPARCRNALLHCITAYPAPEEEYNLRLIPLLSRIFGLPVGVSDHSRDPLLVPLLAVSQGACIVEKHFTLSRKNQGLDDPIALVPEEFSSMCRQIRKGENIPSGQLIEYCRSMFSPDRVSSVLGNGRKSLAPSEVPFYRSTNRSVVALTDLAVGSIISSENTALLRSEQNRRPGVGAHHWKSVIGAALKKPVTAGDGISWDTLL